MKSKTGFTLVEVLITVAVAIVAGTLLISIWVQNNGLYKAQTSKISTGVSLNDALTDITESIKNSATVASNYPAQPSVTTDTDTLVLALPSINANGYVIENVYDYVVITKDPQKPKLLRKFVYPNAQSTRPKEEKLLSNVLTNVIFNYYDDNGNPVSPTNAEKITFIIQTSEKAGNGQNVASSSGQASLRNN